MFKSDSTIANSPVSQFRKRSNRARRKSIGQAVLELFCHAHGAKEWPAESRGISWLPQTVEFSHSGAFHEDRNSVVAKILIELHITDVAQ
jgi:hypothetical protein